IVTLVPTGPPVGVKPVMVGGPTVTVSVLLAGDRPGAETVTVTVPVVAPAAVMVAALWPARMRTDAGMVTLPVPEGVTVPASPPVGAGVAEDTVSARLWPTRSVAEVGVRLNAGPVDTTVKRAVAETDP